MWVLVIEPDKGEREVAQGYIGTIEAAALLGPSPQTIRVMMKNGTIPSVRIGRRFYISRTWAERVRLAAEPTDFTVRTGNEPRPAA